VSSVDVVGIGYNNVHRSYQCEMKVNFVVMLFTTSLF